MKNISQAVQQERKRFNIFPKQEQVMRAFHLCPYSNLKCVIIGQDPYHTPGMATGLSFGIPEDAPKTPPSLRNILKEMEEDLGFKNVVPKVDLTSWAQSGVLLLNRSLTVREGVAGSHAGLGWMTFTKRVIEIISEGIRPVVFILWGNHARMLKSVIDQETHFIIESAHPSPLSAHRGFFGSKPFSRADAFIKSCHDSMVNWQSVIDWDD